MFITKDIWMISLFCLINQNMQKFSIETEINFLDVKTFRENDKFATSVFRKETFSGGVH